MAENVQIPEEMVKMMLTGASKADIIAAFSEELYEAAMGQTDAVSIETYDTPKS